jgi:hypothetical protein
MPHLLIEIDFFSETDERSIEGRQIPVNAIWKKRFPGSSPRLQS